jgi:WD40 repeat protein
MLIRFMAPEPLRSRVPPTSLSVPSSLNQVGLSAIVAHLLGEEGSSTDSGGGGSTRGFEFCVNAAFAAELSLARGPASDGPPPPRLLLRGSLRAYARALGATGEVAFALDFARAVGPSTPGGIARMPDAVTALCAGGASAVAAGLSNGYLLLARASLLTSSVGGSDTTASFVRSERALHVGAVTGVALADGSNGAMLATGGRDGAVRLWSIKSESTTTTSAITIGDQIAELIGADGPVGRVAFDPSRTNIAAGDGAGNVLIWSSAEGSSSLSSSNVSATGGGGGGGAVKVGKRARGSNVAETTTMPTTNDRTPLFRLNALSSSGSTSSIAWCSSTILASGGWDGAVRVYDIADSVTSATTTVTSTPIVTTLRAKKPVTALTSSTLGGLLASGHTDGCIRLWDSRGRATVDAPTLSLSSANADGLRTTLRGTVSGSWVSDVSFAPVPHLLLTADYSGSSYLWDIRAPAGPLSIMTRHEGKVFAASWVNCTTGLCLASGGEDATIRLANIPQ